MSEPARPQRVSDATPEQPTLVAGDVTLRPWRLGDASTVLPLYDTEVARLFGLGGDAPALSRMQEAILRWRQGYADARKVVSFLVVGTSDPVPVGMCQVKDANDDVGVVSWTTYAPYRQRGYTTAAVLTLCRYAFSDLGMARLEAYLEPGRTASSRVASRAGFTREGLLRDKATLDGSRRNLVLYARLATDPAPVLPLTGRRRS